jgi:hypothetical protein
MKYTYNVQNKTALNPRTTGPDGYVSSDGMWAVVPFGKKFILIHNGEQIEEFTSVSQAKKYIAKQKKSK